MGNFYTNIMLKGLSPERVIDALAGRNAFVSRLIDNAVIVADEQCEEQLTPALSSLAYDLSARLAAPVMAVMNHDDDVLWLHCYVAGATVGDEYVSAPGYFSGEESPPSGGDSEALAKAFGRPGAAAEIERILRAESSDYTFASERHSALLVTLGLPEAACGVGYRYIDEGDIPGGLTESDFVHVT
jgi:hypothetical protein